MIFVLRERWKHFVMEKKEQTTTATIKAIISFWGLSLRVTFFFCCSFVLYCTRTIYKHINSSHICASWTIKCAMTRDINQTFWLLLAPYTVGVFVSLVNSKSNPKTKHCPCSLSRLISRKLDEYFVKQKNSICKWNEMKWNVTPVGRLN